MINSKAMRKIKTRTKKSKCDFSKIITYKVANKSEENTVQAYMNCC